MDNLEIYNKKKQPPDWALKEIQAGRLRGKTDINPQWRIEALTELFGVVGIGWKYQIVKLWTETTGNEVLAFAHVDLYFKDKDGIWSDPIQGIGGSMMVAMEKNGAYNSDECYKMAITDAISVCCKMLGIGGAVYSGSKYPTTPAPTKVSDETIEKEIKATTTREELTKVYSKYKKEITANDKLYEILKSEGAKYGESSKSNK